MDAESVAKTNGTSSPAIVEGDTPAALVPKMDFFNSVLNPPDWLDQSYLEKVLQNYERDPQLKVTSCSIGTATKPGDNFVGVIFRAAVTFVTRGAEKKDSLILKIEPFLEGMKKEMMANQPFFDTEYRMYSQVLPAMQDLLKNSGDPEIIAPELVYWSPNPKLLVFKDIGPDGFVMQHQPLPLAGVSKILRKLGKFHALSYYLIHEQGDENLKSFKDGMLTSKFMANFEFMKVNFDVFAELCGEWGEQMATVGAKLKALSPNYAALLKKLYAPTAHGINILNHGDFHIRNLLFRWDSLDSSKLDAISFIDFQLSIYATPAIDLFYALYMNADLEAREQHRDELLKIYHDQFVDTLNKLGFMRKPPSLLDLQVELLRNGLIEVFVAINFMPMFHMDPAMMADMDFANPAAYVRRIFELPALKDILQRLLPKLMHKGLLEENV